LQNEVFLLQLKRFGGSSNHGKGRVHDSLMSKRLAFEKQFLLLICELIDVALSADVVHILEL
jgi:hypothetical protein